MRPTLLLLDTLRAGLLLLSLTSLVPFRLSLWTEGDRLGVFDRIPARGDIVRRGDLSREGVGDLAKALSLCRDRVRPLSGDEEGMLTGMVMLIRCNELLCLPT